MCPDNVAAHALKEELKAQLRLGSPQQQDARRSSESQDRWAGVAGMRELKAILERDVVLPLAQPDLYAKYRVPLPNGILLYGPPGCGKTHIARILGRLLGFEFIEVRPSDLASIYVHGTQERIGQLFTRARKLAPCLLFIDELDAALPNRGEQTSHHYSAEVNEWLTQLNKASEQRVLVIGATNRLDVIDPAALRPGRFDKKIFIGPPDLEARVDLLRLYLRGRPLGTIDFMALARESQGYTCAELELVVNEAARHALDRARNIESEDLVRSMANNLPRHAEESSRDSE
jgi:transitional endoplasmic reticulum ATPase